MKTTNLRLVAIKMCVQTIYKISHLIIMFYFIYLEKIIDT